MIVKIKLILLGHSVVIELGKRGKPVNFTIKSYFLANTDFKLFEKNYCVVIFQNWKLVLFFLDRLSQENNDRKAKLFRSESIPTNYVSTTPPRLHYIANIYNIYYINAVLCCARGVTRSWFGTGGLIIADIINPDEGSGVPCGRWRFRWMGVGEGEKAIDGCSETSEPRRNVRRGAQEGGGRGSQRLSASAIDAALCLRPPCLQRTVWRDVSVPDNLITSQHSTPSCATVSCAL